MEKQQAEFADSPMLKFSTYLAGLRQWCILKVSEPEVHCCGEFAKTQVRCWLAFNNLLLIDVFSMSSAECKMVSTP